MAAQSELVFRFGGTRGATLDVVRFELIEGVSQPFRLELELGSSEPDIESDILLDSEVVFTIERDGEPVRTVHGICTAFEQCETGFRLTRYRAVVESPLARLALRHNSRIFQQVNAPEILETILKEHRFQGTKTTYLGHHEPREYATQYREHDDRFVHRLATEEGIVYWHDAANQSRLVLTDRIDTAPTLDGKVLYQPAPVGDAPQPHLWHFAHRRQLAPTRVTQRDATFHNPRYDLQHEARPWSHDKAIGDYEHYDYPGRYKAEAAGKPFTRTKLSGLRNLTEHAAIEGDDARLWPGLAFELTGHPTEALNARWRVIAMRHSGEQATSQEADAAGAEHGTRYRYEATVVPAHYDWKPEPAPRSVIEGPQIAHVVGPPGEEIHTDVHGRVQMYFPWDREGNWSENSTCWIRVSQGWAGPMYGFMAIPRIGHEVIVSFMEGDPDQPIVTGRTYHAANKPPYELPLHKTRTTFKTQTHKGKGYNELRFEDEAGQEEIFVHAQKDQNIVVENDETTRIGHDRSEDVSNDETIQIGHDRKEAVGNDETLSIGQDRRETLGRDHVIDIGRTRQLTIGKDLIEDVGNVRIEKTASDRKVETGGHYEHKVAERHDIEAGERITQRTRVVELKASESLRICGLGGTITLDGSGVTIEGLEILLKGPVQRDPDGAGNDFSIFGEPAEGDVPDFSWIWRPTGD
ncbi:type VI secretion system Vgr family protein [Lysobacter changpingensis]|uniref:type VI secretion system Vgr family protein n=1 Tax=Lysobacter changpingensis TaxID=2792784 RepID=UPI001A8EC026|nr:type VI secretion system tip protein TssI/VgrG [Lysobacter changpingensis]